MHLLKKKYMFLFLVLGMLVGCQTVKPYQRAYLNDPEMQMGLKAGQGFEAYVESIREGATPPGGAKTSGGCGCN
jgi:hypothetical protein